MNAAKRNTLDPAALSLRMQVLEPEMSDDGLGGQITSFTLRRSVWAAFEPSLPAQRTTTPLSNALAQGQVRTRIGMCPPVGWRLSWNTLGSQRTVQVIAIERGTPAYPFDVCVVDEIGS